MEFNDRLLSFSLVARGCLSGTTWALNFVPADRLGKVVELSLNLLHLVNDRHILFDQVFLRLADLGDQSMLPVLDIVLLVCRAHQLLLHGEVANMLLLEGVDEQFDTCLAVLALHQRRQLVLHQLLKVIVLLCRTQHGGHAPEAIHPVFDCSLLHSQVRLQDHVGRHEH